MPTNMIYLSSSIESHCAALTTDRWLHLETFRQTTSHVVTPPGRPSTTHRPFSSDILCESSQLLGLFGILLDDYDVSGPWMRVGWAAIKIVNPSVKSHWGCNCCCCGSRYTAAVASFAQKFRIYVINN